MFSSLMRTKVGQHFLRGFCPRLLQHKSLSHETAGDTAGILQNIRVPCIPKKLPSHPHTPLSIPRGWEHIPSHHFSPYSYIIHKIAPIPCMEILHPSIFLLVRSSYLVSSSTLARRQSLNNLRNNNSDYSPDISSLSHLGHFNPCA